MPTFTGNRLLLTPLSVADADQIYHLYDNPEILKLYSSRPIANKNDTVAFIQKITSNGNMVWNIRLNENPDIIIGNCALHDLNPENKSIEIGGSILPQFWGQGIMQEAFTLLIDYAASELQAYSIIGKTLTRNRQAIRLVEKLGFILLNTDGDETIMVRNIH